MTSENVYNMKFGKIYPLLVNKAMKKGRTQGEVDQIITWLTGYTRTELEAALDSELSYGDFFRNAPSPNPARNEIKGVVCGVPGCHRMHPGGDPFGFPLQEPSGGDRSEYI